MLFADDAPMKALKLRPEHIPWPPAALSAFQLAVHPTMCCCWTDRMEVGIQSKMWMPPCAPILNTTTPAGSVSSGRYAPSGWSVPMNISWTGVWLKAGDWGM